MCFISIKISELEFPGVRLIRSRPVGILAAGPVDAAKSLDERPSMNDFPALKVTITSDYLGTLTIRGKLLRLTLRKD